jgi:hypothetical protein
VNNTAEIKSPLARKGMDALQDAVAKVVEDHRRRRAPLAVWRDGKAVYETPPPLDNTHEEQGAYHPDATTSPCIVDTDQNKKAP